MHPNPNPNPNPHPHPDPNPDPDPDPNQAVVAEDIAKAKDGSLQAGEGHFKFGVSAGKRPQPTSTTSASSTKLDVKPKTDLHQTKHTTLTDEHNKPDANKELPSHPATTSKGAASYLESTKKVSAQAVTQGGAAAVKAGAAGATAAPKVTAKASEMN